MTGNPSSRPARASRFALTQLLPIAVAIAAVVGIGSFRNEKAEAAFHFAAISEVMFGYNGDPNIQYVEVQMQTSGQNLTAHAILGYFDSTGAYAGDILEVPANVQTGDSGGRWIMASTAFAAASGITPDFTFPPVASFPTTGMVCVGGGGGVVPLNPPTWTRTTMTNWFDCVPFGGYTGPPIKHGPASPFGPGDGTSALTRTTDTDNTSVDFALACPTPQNNRDIIGFNHDDHIDLPANRVFDDITWPNSDATGDRCGDADDDNDGLSDANEAALPGVACPAATAATNPLSYDTDGDRALDGAECALGTDPTNSSVRPSNTACGAATDADDDGILARFEFCHFNTDPNNINTDGDSCNDGTEVASINGDTPVNSTDQLILATVIGKPTTDPLYHVDFDLNRDGAINSVDQLLMAKNFGPCP